VFSNAQTQIPAGDVHGSWGISGSPYNIQGDITIPNDSTLSIEPGVVIEFQGYFTLNVQGRLLASGTETDTILFTINDTTGFFNRDTTLGGWNGIQFIDTPPDNDTSKINFCKLQYAKAFGINPPENSGGAIVVYNFNKVLISNCLIINNSAGGTNSPAGGGIYLAFASIWLQENVITNNKAWDGGGILIWECDPIFVGNLIDSNHADEGGGGVWIGGTSNTDFNFDIISNNVAGGNGGGIICWLNTNTNLNTVNVLNNSANWGGGAGAIDCEMHFSYVNFIGNAAIGLGGGLGADFSTIHIHNTTFAGDTSGFLSGAIHSWYSDLQIKHSLFNDNESNSGGAIHAEFSTLQIDSTSFIGNIADNGAGLHIWNSDLSVDSCLFFQNIGAVDGGAIDLAVDTTEYTDKYQVKILNSRFLENAAFRRASIGVQQFDSELSLLDVKVDNCLFFNNTVDRGGNLLIGGFIDDFIISNSIFSGNTATLRTAGFLFSDHVNGEVSNCLFTSNHALNGSSASSIGSGSIVSFINCTFAYNSGGAALTLRNDARSVLVNNIFWGNLRSSIIMNAVNDSTPGNLTINYSDIQYGLDSIVVNDTVSIVNWGTANIDADPFFADTINYHLSDSSLCIGTGIDSIQIAGIWYIAPPTDIEGITRPTPPGSMPDIGAWENERSLPIPVELKSFTATLQANKVTLNWITVTELNNLGFEIERKIMIDTKGEWTRIGFVKGYGTTTEKQRYQYVDKISDLKATSLIYRLKQLDFDGSYEYSEEVFVDNPVLVDYALHQNFPNPFNPTTTIKYSIPKKSQVELAIYNTIGEKVDLLVNEEKSAGTYEVEFNSQGLTSGIYFYQLKSDDYIKTKKMVLLR
jgi:hypothetical protein